jgi:hypothetical protein
MINQKWTEFLVVFLLTPFLSWSQILNSDREGTEDSVFKKWKFSGALTFSADKQKSSLFDVSSNLELYRNFINNYYIIGLVKNDAIYNGKSSIQNEGQLQLRYRDNDTRKYSIEYFTQYQWNGAWGMEFRYLFGSNLRMKFFEEKKSDLYIALGLFREWERWNWSGVRKVPIPPDAQSIENKIYRLNSYAKYSIKLNDKIDISTLSYLQFPLQGSFFNPRWYFESNLYLTVGKHINFLIHWDHIMDKRRLVPIDNFYYTFTTGIQFNY